MQKTNSRVSVVESRAAESMVVETGVMEEGGRQWIVLSTKSPLKDTQWRA